MGVEAPRVDVRVLSETDDDESLGRALVREYTEATAVEMAAPGEAPNVERLLPHIPDWHDFAGRYFGGAGAFLVAQVAEPEHDGGPAVVGCVGLVRATPEVCEMNRLWVRPPFRRHGVAQQLVLASIAEARRRGFARIALDALVTRTTAIALYRKLGFEDAPPRHHYGFEVVALEKQIR